MELRAFAICRSCYEVHVAQATCPHCERVPAAPAPPPPPDLTARGSLADDEPFEDTTAIQLKPRWTPVVAIASAALAITLLLVSAIQAA